MYPAIKQVIPQKNYTLLLTYENGEKKKFDMKPYLETGIFRELKDLKIFYSVKPCFDSVEWINEADIDPEILYQESVKIDK